MLASLGPEVIKRDFAFEFGDLCGEALGLLEVDDCCRFGDLET
jgi:hypothetical protein